MNRCLIVASAAAAIAALSGCSGIVQQPADPAMVARIRAACMADGVFKDMGGRLVLSMIPVPGVATADRIISMGIDIVCANPERFAADLSTAEWVIRNLRG